MRVLILGSGGREHALAYALARDEVHAVLCAPGSDGIAADVPIAPVDPLDPGAVVALAEARRAELVVVGPEAPLAAGVADRLEAAGIPVFGPSAAAARLESSKEFAKAFMARHGIPTAEWRAFDDADEAERYVMSESRPLVVKADGLAAGKGVAICETREAARAAIGEMMRARRFGASGARVVIEECLRGEEASYYVLCDGDRIVPLGGAQDYKRAQDGDRGENTGGMGAYSPAPVLTAAVEASVLERIARPVVAGMRQEGAPYRGVLYIGLMIEAGEPRVIEFNCRFGDPETQPMMVRVDTDLVPWLAAAARGELPEHAHIELRDAGVCVVMASEGYPRAFDAGHEIEGLAEASSAHGVKVFHAATRLANGRFTTAGGRVLGVTARGETLADAHARAYRAVETIRFKGAHYRRDIAPRALSA
jgi:phosphoribosylamine--glycine ligase